jgi:hypothetical protein
MVPKTPLIETHSGLIKLLRRQTYTCLRAWHAYATPSFYSRNIVLSFLAIIYQSFMPRGYDIRLINEP